MSGGNFLTSLILARTLGKTEYGTFSLLFLALISLNTLHFSLVIYPMTINVARTKDSDGSETLVSALLQTIVLAAPWAIFLVVITMQLGRMDALLSMIAAMVAWQMQEVLRRVLIASGKVQHAVLPDLLSYAGQAAILMIFRPHRISVIFLSVALTSVSALVWQILLVRPHWKLENPFHGIRSSWMLGKFTLAANLLNMGILQYPSWTLDFFAGRASVANYQSMATLVGIANPIILSMSNMLIPSIARASLDGVREARRVMNRYGLLFGAMLSPAFVLLGVFPHFAMKLAYGPTSPYLVLAPLLRIFAGTFLLQFLATLIGAYEGGLARPQTYMYVQIASFVALATVGTYLIHAYGVSGAVLAGLVAAAVRMVFFWAKSRHADRQASQTSAA